MNSSSRSHFAALILALLHISGGSAAADGLIIIRPPRPLPHHERPILTPLEVKNHFVDVTIKNQIATTSVDQTFRNPGNQRLEGEYIFPVPKGAQIDKFSMEIDGTMTEAELLPADKARKIYEDIVRQMKDPALMEYAGRDMFKVRVFPIEPKSDKRIKLSYTQLIKSENGLTEYIYPLNTEKFSASPIETVSVRVKIDCDQPLKSVYSPSHEVEIKRNSDTQATLGFEAKNKKPDSDFIVYYGTDQKRVGANLLCYRNSGEEGFFLLLASPGVSRPDGAVSPKDVTFVVDTSGSMSGEKLPQAKRALQFCIDNLNEVDRFEIIRFSTEAEPLFSGLVEANQANRDKAATFIKKLKPTGGTAINDALAEALKHPESTGPARPHLIVFLTDGQPTIGETSEAKILERLAEAKSKARVFCFGIGTDINTHLLDKIAEKTRASTEYVLPEENIEIKVSGFFAKVTEPVLASPKLVFPTELKVTKMYPNELPDFFKGEQVIVAGRYAGTGKSTVKLEGTVDGEAKEYAFDVEFAENQADLAFLPRLWAMRRIGYLLDQIRLNGESSELKDEVAQLAKEFGIVTPYTAFLILEDEKKSGITRSRQMMSRLEGDALAQEALRSGSGGNYKGKSGENAVANAKEIRELKDGLNTDAQLARAQNESANYYRSAAPTAADSAKNTNRMLEVINQSASQTRYVGGRNFYQNGKRWIDSSKQNQQAKNRVQVKFNSDEYFRLAAEHPAALPWMALGQEVEFALGDTVYEIVPN